MTARDEREEELEQEENLALERANALAANVRSYCERIGRSAVDAKTRWNGVVTISANDRQLAVEPIVGKENWRVDGQEVSHVEMLDRVLTFLAAGPARSNGARRR